ncbi:hypothetical protein AN218_12415 [Streptomyces nanshensis]|uniref:Uncharacterized protein n=1 Tax=Streptomyces nanshensis TaxID=518642 RepID=A0A1E7L5S5_9ACTN|nr:hypothetical protein AN218_12415 [Streptomyces nanshensis]
MTAVLVDRTLPFAFEFALVRRLAFRPRPLGARRRPYSRPSGFRDGVGCCAPGSHRGCTTRPAVLPGLAVGPVGRRARAVRLVRSIRVELGSVCTAPTRGRMRRRTAAPGPALEVGSSVLSEQPGILGSPHADHPDSWPAVFRHDPLEPRPVLGVGGHFSFRVRFPCRLVLLRSVPQLFGEVRTMVLGHAECLHER